MSDMSNSELMSIIAVGLGANKGFWMIQPRDDEGQWIEMGGTVLFRFRTGDGNLVVGNALGIYVGPTGKPGRARVLVKEGNKFGLKPGVHEMDSRNLTQVKAYLPEEGVEGISTEGRVDKFGKPVKTLEDSQLPTVDELNQSVQEPTAEDERYSRGELTDEEKTAEQEARNESPIANMPAGFEAENPEEAKQLLRDAGVDVDGITPTELDSREKMEPFRPYDGSGRYNPDIQRENARKLEEQRNVEKELGRKLTAEEISALGLTPRDADYARMYSDAEFIIPGNLTPEQEKRTKDADAKRHAIKARLKAELEGRKAENKDVAAEAVVKNAFQDAYDGDSPSVEELEDSSLALARELDNGTVDKMPFDVVPGDTIVGEDGQEYQVLEVSGRGAGSVRFRLQTPDGRSGYQTVPSDSPVAVANRRQPARPARPARPAPRPEEPREQQQPTPEAVEQPTTQEPASIQNEAEDSDGIDLSSLTTAKPDGTAPAEFPPADRMDDGSEFELPTLSEEQLEQIRNTRLTPIMGPGGVPIKYVDENNKVVAAEDPFAMMSALSRIYPNAMFTPSGALVLHRQRDKDGRIFELRANNSGKRAVVYTMRWTNPETGEYREFQHKDDRHSMKALFTETNGPQGLLDRLLGRVDNKGKDWGSPENYFFGNTKFNRNDSLFKRLRWFMSGTGDRKKMEELGKNAVRLAEGNNAIYHDDERMILKHQEIPSLWEAFDEYFKSGPDRQSRDLALREDLFHVLYGIFGRAPLGPESHKQYRTALRAEFQRQFPNASLRMNQTFQGIITSASERMRGIYRDSDPDVRAIGYASKDRTRPIEAGQVVEYTNNVGEPSTLKVLSLIENISVSPTNSASYDYGDYVIVQDANGNKRKINALKLRILDNQQSALTAYKQNLRGEELARRRREIEGIPEPVSELPSIPEPPVGTRTVVSDPPPPPMLIDDFIAGDMLYNKSGQPLGIIKTDPRPVKSRDGSEALAFLYTAADGTEGTAIYKLGTEIQPKKA